MEQTWKTYPVPLCTLNVPLQDLAAALEMPLQSWSEPGLGEASVLTLHPSAGTLLLEELVHARKFLGARGPTIYVDAARLVQHGIESVITSALTTLNLRPENVDWSQSEGDLAPTRAHLASLSQDGLRD